MCRGIWVCETYPCGEVAQLIVNRDTELSVAVAVILGELRARIAAAEKPKETLGSSPSLKALSKMFVRLL